MVGYSFSYIYYNMILVKCKVIVRLKLRNDYGITNLKIEYLGFIINLI